MLWQIFLSDLSFYSIYYFWCDSRRTCIVLMLTIRIKISRIQGIRLKHNLQRPLIDQMKGFDCLTNPMRSV